MRLPRLAPEYGPILKYIDQLPPKEKEGVRNAMLSMLTTPEGVIFMDLLEKATIERTMPINGEPRALDALNAQALIAHDLRRIVSDDEYVAVKDPARSRR